MSKIPQALESISKWKVDWSKIIFATNKQVLPYNFTCWYRYSRANAWSFDQSEGNKVPPTRDKHNSHEGKMISDYYVKKRETKLARGKNPKPNFVIMLWINVQYIFMQYGNISRTMTMFNTPQRVACYHDTIRGCRCNPILQYDGISER